MSQQQQQQQKVAGDTEQEGSTSLLRTVLLWDLAVPVALSVAQAVAVPFTCACVGKMAFGVFIGDAASSSGGGVGAGACAEEAGGTGTCEKDDRETFEEPSMVSGESVAVF